MGVTSCNQVGSLDELTYADFGDKRLGKRLLKMVKALSKNPEGTLPGALKCPFSIKAAYRFLDNEKTSYEQVLAPHIQETRRACSLPGTYLLIEDTTNVSFNDRSSILGMGQHTTAESLGLLLHSTLAFRIKSWSEKHEPSLEQVGLFGQRCWTRHGEHKRGKESIRPVMGGVLGYSVNQVELPWAPAIQSHKCSVSFSNRSKNTSREILPIRSRKSLIVVWWSSAHLFLAFGGNGQLRRPKIFEKTHIREDSENDGNSFSAKISFSISWTESAFQIGSKSVSE